MLLQYQCNMILYNDIKGLCKHMKALMYRDAQRALHTTERTYVLRCADVILSALSEHWMTLLFNSICVLLWEFFYCRGFARKSWEKNKKYKVPKFVLAGLWSFNWSSANYICIDSFLLLSGKYFSEKEKEGFSFVAAVHSELMSPTA